MWAWAWRAWHRLALDRPYYGGGMGALVPGPIPLRDIYWWCENRGGDPDELDTICRAMDTEYIQWRQDQTKNA